MADWLGVDMAEGICSIVDCECRAFSRGWCHAHYQRWWRHGDPLGGRLTGRYAHKCQPPRACAVEGCQRHYVSNGYCELHYLRWSKSEGDLAIVATPGQRRGALNGTWRGSEAGYEAVHGRLNRQRGRASEHSCVTCGEPAVDWAYDHQCPDEKAVERRGRLYAYSTDPDRYSPLCRSCHTRLDKGIGGRPTT